EGAGQHCDRVSGRRPAADRCARRPEELSRNKPPVSHHAGGLLACTLPLLRRPRPPGSGRLLNAISSSRGYSSSRAEFFISVAERRQNLAQGVSPGDESHHLGKAPAGRQKRTAKPLSPLRGLRIWLRYPTHG